MDPPTSTQGDRERPKHVKYASIDPVYPKAALAFTNKTHTRRRTERDLPYGHGYPKAHVIQALLTPPLTPASSIRTSGSSRDSAAERCLGDRAEPEKVVESKEEKTSEQFKALDSDEKATRIVLLRNLDPTLSISSLESAIIEAVRGGIGTTSNPSYNPSLTILKSLTTQPLSSTGLGLACACAVFFDVRCAKALVQRVGADAGTCWLEKIGPKEKREGKGKVEARFVTTEEALEFFGTSDSASSFNADDVEGSIYVTVQKSSPLPVNLTNPTSHVAGTSTGQDQGQDENDTSSEKETSNVDINTSMLFSLLKSFGSLRRFDFDAEAGEKHNSGAASTLKNQTETKVVYRVEYHDLRDAERVIEELDGRTMFGMSLGFEIGGLRDPEGKATATIKAAEAAAADEEELTTPPIVLAPAGVQSNVRKRFRFAEEEDTDVDDGGGAATGDAGETIGPQTTRDALLDVGSAGNGTGTPSPTFFYTSSTGYPQEPSGQPKEGLGERDSTLEPQVPGSGHSFGGTSAGAAAEVAFTSGSHVHSSVGSTTNQWDGQGMYHPQQQQLHQIQIPEASGTTSTTTPTTSSVTSLTSNQSNATAFSPCYGTSPDGVCLYCPSRGPHPTHAPQMGYGATYPGYGLSPPPPPLPASSQNTAAAMAAGMYYPPPTSMPLPGLSISPGQGSGQAPPLAVSMSMGGYEYLDSHMQVGVGGVGGSGGIVMSPQQAHAQVGMGGAWTPGYHDPSIAAAGGMVPLPMGMGVPGVGVGMNMMNMGVGMNMGLGMGMPVGGLGGLSMPPPPLPSYMGYVQREDASALVGGGVAVSPDGRTYLYSHYPQHGHGLANYAHSHSHGPGHFVPQAHGIGIGIGIGGETGLTTMSSGSDSSPNASSGLKGRSGTGANQLSTTTGTAVRTAVGTRPTSSSVRRSGSRLHHHQDRHTQQKQQQDLEFEHIRRPASSPSPPPPAFGIHGSPSLGPSPPPPLQLNDRNQVTDRNQLNIARIEEGLDTRTTVMIKNIPNKMSDRDLMVFIERVCPRRIDFFYLRMDFQNGCNVGYAFVNFIHVQDLLRFAKARLGVKWNMFSSEKVLQMSYANYQGKEALVEKFKNSAIMDEREAWRPRIFYSLGQNQGLPEPFPPPTHMRRKERSSFNRGALFVPGIGHGVNGHGHGVVGSGIEGPLCGGNGVGGLPSRGSQRRRFGHGQLDSADVHGSQLYSADAGGTHRWGTNVSVSVSSEYDSEEASRRDKRSSVYRKKFGM